ncbi:site-specific integrase [Hahella aquimaris]|uniref:tyrosine-type recombinase/integrase n=1 Tax=Hahella sp. HNIBRBA332 TaxID=3015983 RepID=UPI00273C63F4|nr:site-specific integrase [Hahella sp. HNIBRBA332]WLQ15606.1 site-specific integrase [Hahella sp. HNIBRBA332]
MGITVRYRQSRDRWVVTETYNGERVQTTFRTEKEARQYAAKSTTELNEAIHNGKMGRKPKRTFLEAAMRWVNEYNVESQHHHIERVAEYMGDEIALGMELVDKTRAMAKELRESGLSQSTINNRVQIVKRVLNLAYREWDWIEEPLGQKLKKPDPKNARHVYLTPSQVLMLATSVPEDCMWVGRVIILSAFTGLRQGELLKLGAENYIDGRIMLRPDQTKNGKPRIVPVLQEMREWLEGTLPFPIKYQDIRRGFECARTQCKMEHVRFHDLRHTYASFLAASNAPITAVRDLLGHSSLIVTSRYAHLFTSTLDDTVSNLPRINLSLMDKRDQTATKH